MIVPDRYEAVIVKRSHSGIDHVFQQYNVFHALIGGLPVPPETGPAGSKTADVTSALACFRPDSFSQGCCAKRVCVSNRWPFLKAHRPYWPHPTTAEEPASRQQQINFGRSVTARN